MLFRLTHPSDVCQPPPGYRLRVKLSVKEITMCFRTVLLLSVFVSGCFAGALNIEDHAEINGNSSEVTFEDAYYPALNWSDEIDWKLLKALERDNPNVLISPLSLKIALAIIYEGSSGLTENEFQSALNFESKEAVRSNYNRIIRELQNGDGFSEIRIATRIFLDANIIPKQKYTSNVKASYYTDVESTQFVNPEQASRKINAWANIVTKGYITEMIKPDDLEDVVLLATNAVFFRGFWKNAFPESKSKSGNFYVTPTSHVAVQYMNMAGKFYYMDSRELEAQILRIPYKGGKFAFFILLPNSRGGLHKLINSIDLTKLKRNVFNLDEVAVDVTLPKFKFDFTCSYSRILQNLGLRQMFTNTASLPGIARGFGYGYRTLLVNDIRQKSGIELNEEGSVIVSATDIQVGNKFGDVDYIFNASHPFMFFVEEQISGSILFVGKVENPLLSQHSVLPLRFGDNGNKVATAALPVAHTPIRAGIELGPLAPPDNSIQSRFNYFDLELLRTFGNDSNYVISPASIKTTLGMLLEGARGRGADEISELLRIPATQQGVRDKLQSLLYDLNDKSGTTTLNSANALFLSSNFRVSPSYQHTLHDVYRAIVRSLNFSNKMEAAAVINRWVGDATRGHIPELVDSGGLDAHTSAVIANALYFKGKWRNEFSRKNTVRECFNVKGVCTLTPMMRIVTSLNYKFIDEVDSFAVELPYSDGKYAMLILLPSVKGSVEGLIRDLQHVSFASIVDALEETEVSVEIPRFEIEYTAEMVPALYALGIRAVFEDTADLSGITEDGNVKVDSVLHKSKIEVNEEGTVAAAATGTLIVPLMKPDIPEIKANRPFLFFIYHVGSRNIIFEGKFNQPDDSDQTYQRPDLSSSLQQVNKPSQREVEILQSKSSNRQFSFPYENTNSNNQRIHFGQ